MSDPKKPAVPDQGLPPSPNDGVAGPEDVTPENIDENFREGAVEPPVDAPPWPGRPEHHK